MSDSTIRIGQKSVGAAHPPLVIAEMSGNHNGSLEKAREIVRAVADSGADAIKLQTFTAATLTLNSSRPDFFIRDPGSLWDGRRLWELYEEAHTPWEWHQPLFELARSHGLACISSAFDESSVKFLLELNIDAIKIASFELVHLPLIEAAAKSGKPMLLSTGMASHEEINDAVSVLAAHQHKDFILLKCTSAYPSEEKHANLLTLPDMGSRYGCQVGLSDHTLKPYAALAAVALGATVLEKHVTLRRAEGGVDAAFSLEPAELRELVDGAHLAWQSRGRVAYGTQAVEETSRRERPSLYVTRRMKKGEIFCDENLRVIRPGFGLPPKHYREIFGRRAACDIDAEMPLSWDQIEPRP